MDDLDLGATIKGFSPGQKILNRYTLKQILGRGGMGVVWLARDMELERDIALKFLPEAVALDAEAVADLKRETRRNLDLTHPHIVRIHDFVSDKRTAAIAMEYVKGATLAALKLERPGRVFTVAELRPWVEQFLEALHYAHAKARVVHRDLKPANLMIADSGDLKITDFGIATSITDSVSRVSKQAGSSGTPLYMSPQQMMGEKAAVTDDLYAVGATLYELLTSKPPFYSGNVIVQVQDKEAPAIAERRAELGIEAEPVPPEWERAILSCLAKDPAARPQSSKDLAGRLAAPAMAAPEPAPKVAEARPNVVVGEPASAAAKKTSSARIVGLLVGAAVLAVLTVVGYQFFTAAPGGTPTEEDTALTNVAVPRNVEGPNGYYTEYYEGMGTVAIATKLWKAAYDGDLAKVRELLAQGADPNLECAPYFPGLPSNMPSQRPLVAAVGQKHSAVVSVLIEGGSKIDSRERLAAIRSGDVSSATLLLTQGKASEAEDSAMHEAVWSDNPAMVRLVAQKIPDSLNKLQKLFIYEMEIGFTYPLIVAVERSKPGVLEALLEAKADLEVKDHEGLTPLHHAAAAGSLSAVRLLLQNGANPKAKTNAGKTPAQVASGEDKEKKMQLLQEAGGSRG